MAASARSIAPFDMSTYGLPRLPQGSLPPLDPTVEYNLKRKGWSDYDILDSLWDIAMEWELYENLYGPGKWTNHFGLKGMGKTAWNAVVTERLLPVSKAYVITNIKYFAGTKWDWVFAPLPVDPADPKGPKLPYAKVNYVANAFQMFFISCQIRARWLASLTPQQIEGLMYGEVPEDIPWIVVLLDEMGTFLSRMRSSTDEALIVNQFIDHSRKLGWGIGGTWHLDSEVIIYVRSTDNVSAKLYKTSKETAEVYYRGRDRAVNYAYLTDIPRPYLPFDTHHSATFNALLFPQSRLQGVRGRFGLADLFLMAQEEGLDSIRFAPRVIDFLEAAAEVAVRQPTGVSIVRQVVEEKDRARAAAKKAEADKHVRPNPLPVPGFDRPEETEE